MAQGVSLYRAVTTGKFHSTDGRPVIEPTAYDPAGIRQWIEHILKIENDNLNLLCSRQIRFRIHRDIWFENGIGFLSRLVDD